VYGHAEAAAGPGMHVIELESGPTAIDDEMSGTFIERWLQRLALAYNGRLSASDSGLIWRAARHHHAAPLHSCKYRWLHAPATKDTCDERSSDSGDLFVCTVAPSMAARPLNSI
jgi:hypothetical protein